MARVENWTPQGVMPAVLLPFRSDFSIDMHNRMKEVPATPGRRPPAIVRPPLVQSPDHAIERLLHTVAHAGPDRSLSRQPLAVP